jgi:YYY domain-containing protein
MTAWIAWYLIVTLLGWLTFPLVYRLFPALADRGYSLARAAGLLIWAYIFWLFTSLGLTANNTGGILFALLVLGGLTVASFYVRLAPPAGTNSADAGGAGADRAAELSRWLRQNLRTLAAVEILFLLAFAFLAFIRAGNPSLDNAEKPMELMFINSILRSPSFPPHDSWLSGYAISYYYFGYVMTAMLAQVTGLTGSIAHNLMTSLVFGLAAIGSFGILYDLLAARNQREGGQAPGHAEQNALLGPAFLAPLFLLLVSNLEGFLEVLHRRGLFWSGAQNFWTWLGIKELSDAPVLPLGWIPDRFWWWWRASRVISDYDLAGNFREVIDEFPFFSFLHADLHPHVLAIPFNLLAIAIALNLFLGGWHGRTAILGVRLKISPAGFLVAALTLGGLAFLNTWDILVGAALIVLAYVLKAAREDGWTWARLGDVFGLGIPLGVVAVLLYLPFYFGFSSQAGGILPNVTNPTRGAQLWVMFAPIFAPLLAFLFYLWRGERRRATWLLSLVLVLGLAILLWATSWAIAWLALLRDPAFAQEYLASQGMSGPAALFQAGSLRRLSYLGGLLSMLAILWPALAFLISERNQASAAIDPPPATRVATTSEASGDEVGARQPTSQSGSLVVDRPAAYVLFLTVIGCLLVIAPEFVFLRDQFASRLNTIFKFYYQAWLLWSLAAAFGVAVLLGSLRGRIGWVFRSALVALLILSLTYPVLALSDKTNGFQPPLGWTLDDFRRIEQSNPDEAAAMLWLKSAPFGVVAEAVGGSYSGFGRISEYTGLPTVLGWPGHESQWRGTSDPQGTRQDDIALLYSTPDWASTMEVLNKYDILYVYIGDLERSTYTLHDEKFVVNLMQVFQQGTVTIYEVP